MGGANLLAARQSYLPLKLNAGGVMPIIFASAVVFLPLTIANVTRNAWLIRIAGYLNPNSSTPWLYALLFFALICGFSFFYASLTVNPDRHRQQPQAQRRGDSRRAPRRLPRRCI